ncbi:MAG: [protein-PII] uridylyltransferase [Gammaproteobacteria bacterium]|uniref:Bifunctional uridylyltransferase/uridylyl-removing enzyme n=1 Tax=Candidatus Thiopontia autotrophica TaxID=2841688 RepID=A0A8J6P5D2_9GAMM|nr:[protein-PII] uridylyltransferase [Candidatus Thiopontia autotrophica]
MTSNPLSDSLNQALTEAVGGKIVDSLKIREILKASQQNIARQFHDGHSARNLIRARSDVIDLILRKIWGNLASNKSAASLIAVGGYGRRELHPFSDIDLLIIPQEGEDSKPIESFITLLWDLGLQIGHSVRSLHECIEEGRADITVATNLLESRLLSGSEEVFTKLQQLITDDSIWPSGPFFIAKRNEQRARLEKQNDTAYNLEPNIKEGPGGLRDIQNIIWVTRRHFGSSGKEHHPDSTAVRSQYLDELIDHNFLTEEESADLNAGQERLWEIRFALHLIAERAEERLLFEHQPELAKYFGHLDSERGIGVESFMHSYFRIIRELSLLNEMLLQLFEEKLLTPSEDKAPVTIDKHFGISGGYLTILHKDSLKRDPSLILLLFTTLRDHPEIKGVTAETIRHIRTARHTIDSDFRQNNKNQQLFLQLFYQPEGLTHTLRHMNRYGILGAYLPAFERIVGLMQYDLFHAYTVDEHTLFVIRNLRRLTIPEFHHESPKLSELILKISHPERLYLAALFHDIAKGRNGDHSQLGVQVVQEFCQQHQIDKKSTDEISWLVQNHLTMSTVAQRKDIDDPAEIHAFAKKVVQQSRLEKLYLLTVADIRATNSTLWNHFKDSLLSRLYQQTCNVLKQDTSPDVIAERDMVEHRKVEVMGILTQKGVLTRDIEQLWKNFEEEYFQKHDSREIYWHTRSILNTKQLPLIQFNRESHHGGSEILIYDRDRQFLFSILVHTMESLGLNIHAAKINTTLDSHALDLFTVLDQHGETIQDREWMDKIRATIRSEINHPTLLSQPVSFRHSRHQKHFRGNSSVTFRQDRRKQQTILEINTTDRPGLLSTICRSLMNCNIRVHAAKIATLGERVEDLFWVTNQNNSPLDNNEQNLSISNQIREALDCNNQ